MSLAWNTKNLLGLESGAESTERTTVEYHFLSWRELYDKSIQTADRYSSGAAQWVIQGDGRQGMYKVRVASRPYYSLPQELCLSFDCFSQTVTKTAFDIKGIYIGPPVERVALEFLALLSLFAREPLIPRGLRRMNETPIIETPHYHYPAMSDKATVPPPLGVNSPEFISLITDFAQAPENLTQAILAATKFYQSGLSLIAIDPSVAYTAFVSAIECLAVYHYADKQFDFDKVEKFSGVGRILEQISELPNTEAHLNALKTELLRVEHFVSHKFVSFFEEFVTDEFWQVRDEVYVYDENLPKITREHFESCLKRIYSARSKYVHEGMPFPTYVEFGLRKRHPPEILHELLNLHGKTRFLPPLAWFERLVHTVIIEYTHRLIAPGTAKARQERLAEKNRLLKIIEGLPSDVQDSLSRLALWTARFLGTAIINPFVANKNWANSYETVKILKEAGVIDGKGDDLEGSSWLKDREVGEAVGEFVFGIEENLFRGNELLLPKGHR